MGLSVRLVKYRGIYKFMYTNLLKVTSVTASVQCNTSNANTIGHTGTSTISNLPANTLAVIPQYCHRTDSYDALCVIEMTSNSGFKVNAKVSGWFNCTFKVLYTE